MIVQNEVDLRAHFDLADREAVDIGAGSVNFRDHMPRAVIGTIAALVTLLGMGFQQLGDQSSNRAGAGRIVAAAVGPVDYLAQNRRQRVIDLEKQIWTCNGFAPVT